MRLSLTPREFGLIMDVLADAQSHLPWFQHGGDDYGTLVELVATLNRKADMYYSSEPDDEDQDEGDDDE